MNVDRSDWVFRMLQEMIRNNEILAFSLYTGEDFSIINEVDLDGAADIVID